MAWNLKAMCSCGHILNRHYSEGGNPAILNKCGVLLDETRRNEYEGYCPCKGFEEAKEPTHIL